MITEDYVPMAVREFARLKALSEGAIAQLSGQQFFEKPGAGDNSIAVMVKHVSGNMRSRWQEFLTSDGEKSDRNRDLEFVILPTDTRDELAARWQEAWSILFASLEPLRSIDLGVMVKIRGEPISVLQAINRQLTHYAYHVGQIVYLAKHLVGSRWKSLSIPVGESEKFNRSPEKYI